MFKMESTPFPVYVPEQLMYCIWFPHSADDQREAQSEGDLSNL